MLLIYNRDGKGGKRRGGKGTGVGEKGEGRVIWGIGEWGSLGRSITFLKGTI